MNELMTDDWPHLAAHRNENGSAHCQGGMSAEKAEPCVVNLVLQHIFVAFEVFNVRVPIGRCCTKVHDVRLTQIDEMRAKATDRKFGHQSEGEIGDERDQIIA